MSNFPRKNDPWSLITELERRIAKLETLVTRSPTMQSGSVVISFSASTSESETVVFPRPYPAGVVPSVMVEHDGGAGFTNGVDSISNTGFTINTAYHSAITGSWTWRWIAAG